MDLTQLPKSSVEELSINSSKYVVNLGFRSGTDMSGFALTPVAAKLLLDALKEHVDSFESKYGPIDTSEAQKHTLSPMQPKKA